MDSIIFDVDGTLWDSTENVAKAWSDCIQQDLGLSMEITAERLHQLFGKVLPEIAARIFPEYDKETQLSYINKCCDKEHEYLLKYGNPTFDKVEETLKILSEKYKLFIVSNCQSGYIEVFLKVTGLSEYFTDYLCSGDTGNHKEKSAFFCRLRGRYPGRSPGLPGSWCAFCICFLWIRRSSRLCLYN